MLVGPTLSYSRIDVLTSYGQPSSLGLLDDKGVRAQYWAMVDTNGRRICLHKLLKIHAERSPHTLHVLAHHMVTAVDIDADSSQATAVRCADLSPAGQVVHGYRTTRIIKPRGGGEIILAAGAIESPRLLLASSIQFGSNGVGENLKDHVVLPLMCIGNWWTLTAKLNPGIER